MSRPDTRSVGRSRAVPYIYGESPRARHDRRLEAALGAQSRVRQWCGNAGVTLTIGNENHHWRFVGGNGCADWWPSSAKLVLDQQWDSGIHVHDIDQLLRELKARFNGKSALEVKQ